jgi:hypothetical protein
MITATSGSDVRLRGVASPSEGDPLDLSGYDLDILTPAGSALSGRVSVEWIDQSENEFEVFIEGTSPIPVGLHGFRVQFDGSGLDSISTPEIRLQVI